MNEDNLFLSIFKENNRNNQNLKEEKLNQMNLIHSSKKMEKSKYLILKKRDQVSKGKEIKIQIKKENILEKHMIILFLRLQIE